MPDLHNALYQRVEEFSKIKASLVRFKTVEKLSAKSYQILLAHQGTPFDLNATVTLPDAYPDKACLFDLSLTTVRTGRGSGSDTKKGGE